MSVQVEFWQLITLTVTLLVAFLTFVAAAGRLLLAQIDRRLNERFRAMEDAGRQNARHWDERFATVIEQNRREADGWSALEKDFLRFQAELPLQYVRREDYVRGQSVIEAKLDALYNKLELVRMKGAEHA